VSPARPAGDPMEPLVPRSLNRSKADADFRRYVAATQARTHRLIAESRELVAEARAIRAALGRSEPPGRVDHRAA
jgi:hypothetical protein